MSHRKKVKILQSLAMILIVLLVSAAVLIMASPGSIMAFVTEGGDTGLVVTVDDELVKVDNLNPGDTKASFLFAENTGTEPFRYFFDIQKTGGLAGFYRGLVSGTLDEVLQITTTYDGAELFSGLVNEFSELDMGILQPGEKKQIDIATFLSGPDVGNEYQGANVTVQFKFRAVVEPQMATLHVRKFRDNNENGTQDTGEPEIQGWIVYINNQPYVTPVSIQLPAGQYTVREANIPGWYPSRPTTVDVTLLKGEEQTVWFGNYAGHTEPDDAQLIVRKFSDLNGDGNWDPNEPEIQGWKVFINGQEYATPVHMWVRPGTYNIAEELRVGWVNTTPASKQTVLAASEVREIIFGNKQVLHHTKATLTVQKFHDYNGNGSWDAGEPEIVDWLVSINDTVYSTPVALNVEPGEYIVAEQLQDGWVATTPIEVTVNLEAGRHERVLFGNLQEFEIIIPPEDPLVDPDDKLPRTGDIMLHYMPYAGVLLIIIGILLRRRKGKRA